MAELAAADPAAGMVLEEHVREEAWRVVCAAIGAGVAPAVDPAGRRGGLLPRLAASALVAMLIVAGAAFASGLVQLGSPARKVEAFQLPDSGFGALVPGSVKLLPVTARDPQGGAPWGMRVFSTTRGAGCIQVGRVVDGQVGVLGADGAFGNDGRLHPLPVASTDELTCSALDANGRIFDNVSKGDELANGLIGPEQVPSNTTPVAHEICAAAAATEAEKSSAENRICPQTEERNVFYGLLGPDAESVTYLEAGRPVTLPTNGPEGAYLIVQDAPSGFQPDDAFGAGETGVVPVDSPITEIHYASGAVCRPGTPGEPACAPGGIPAGYVSAEPAPSAAQAAATVSSQLVHVSTGYEAVVSFKAPVAITNVRDEYKLQWQRQAGSGGVEESVDVREGNVVAGEELTVRSGVLPPGATALHVVLQHADGPALLEGPATVYLPVGTTTVTAPS